LKASTGFLTTRVSFGLIGDFFSISGLFTFVLIDLSAGKFFNSSAVGKLSAEGADSEPEELFPFPRLIKSLFYESSAMII
jgi:hypothetical protein